MEARRIVLVSAEGWQGLYVDGVLATEGRELSAIDALCALGLNFGGFQANPEWLKRADMSLPMALRDVVHA